MTGHIDDDLMRTEPLPPFTTLLFVQRQRRFYLQRSVEIGNNPRLPAGPVRTPMRANRIYFGRCQGFPSFAKGADFTLQHLFRLQKTGPLHPFGSDDHIAVMEKVVTNLGHTSSLLFQKL